MEKLKTFVASAADVASTTFPLKEVYPAVLNEYVAVPAYPIPARPIVSIQIDELMPAMQSGISELRETIVNGYYDALVGDDTSGRIPTLILRGVISHIDRAYGRPSLPAIFVNGRYEGLTSVDEQRLSQKMRALSKRSTQTPRALIVTEYMSGGGHVAGIGKVIHSAGVAYDIFAVGRRNNVTLYRNKGVLQDGENIFPTVDMLKECPRLYNNKELSGYKSGPSGAVKFVPDYRDTFNEARKDVKAAIARLVNNNFR
jgi:hypothetical protein